MLINKFKNIIRNNPYLFRLLWKLREKSGFDRRVLRKGDDVLIEGYPRSANSFSYYAFLLSQNSKLNIGNHCHSPAQFALARKYEIPAILVLRSPVEAVLSYIIYYQNVSARDALINYIDFHLPLVANQEGFVVAPFDEVITDFGKSICRLNRHFNCSFNTFLHQQDNVDEVHEYMKKKREVRIQLLTSVGDDIDYKITLPSQKKEAQKEARLHEVYDPNVRGLLSKAESCYQALISNVDLGN